VTLDDVFRQAVEAFEADPTKTVSITPEQLKRHVPEAYEIYREMKADEGNAKARRRWRRRNVPNTQRIASLSEAVYGRKAPHVVRPRNGAAEQATPFVMPLVMEIEQPRFWLKGDVLP
jgi:hypothetical protein